MGFFGALGRELGKNTGKRISNAIFGDKWSTPYRVGRTKDERKAAEREKPVRESRRQAAPERREYRRRPTAAELREMHEYERRRAEKDERVRQRYSSRIATIVNAAIPRTEDRLVEYLRELAVELSANDEYAGGLQERALRKQLFGAACTKYGQAYAELESRYPRNPFLWDFYCTKIRLFFSRSPWKGLWKAYLVILFLATIAAIEGATYEWLLVVPMAVAAVVPFVFIFVMRAFRLMRYRSSSSRK